MDRLAPSSVSPAAALEAPNGLMKRQATMARLKEGCCGWVGPRIVFPGAISEAPIGLLKNASTKIETPPMSPK